MSKYTTQVRYICESKSGFTPEELIEQSPENIVSAAKNAIFNTDLVIGSEEYSNRIKEMILLRYYTREICEETFALWKLRMNTRLREKVNYYSDLYTTLAKQTSIGSDPFLDVNYSVTRASSDSSERTGNDVSSKTGSVNSESDSSNASILNKTGQDVHSTEYGKTTQAKKDTSETEYNLHSDTPQGGIDGIDAVVQGLEGSGFLTDAQKNTNNGNVDQVETQMGEDVDTTTYGNNVTENVDNKSASSENRDEVGVKNYSEQKSAEAAATEIHTGKRGRSSLMAILAEYRSKLLNLDELIINDFKDLFIMLW